MKLSVRFVLLTAGLLGVLSFASAGAFGQSKPLQLGMAKSFFRERSKNLVDVAIDPFKDVMKKTTGLDGELHSQYEAPEVAEKLEKKQLDFGILHGHEFAWAEKKYPDLRPLLIVVNKLRDERAYVVVRQDSTAKTLADLEGKKIDMPEATKEPCRVYVAKCCADKAKKEPAAFFSAIEKSKTPEAALDETVRGKVQAAIVDGPALDFYKEIKGPVFAKHLKVLEISSPFPPAVIAYKQGALGADTLAKFRDGLLKAHKIREGREMMDEWKVAAFEPIPKDFAKSLAEVLGAYPPPAAFR